MRGFLTFDFFGEPPYWPPKDLQACCFRLEERVAEVGSEQVLKGVAELKRLNRETRKRCVLERVEDTQRLPKDKRPWSQDVVGFRLSEEEDCKFLGMTEIRFIDVLRHMQQKKVDNWKLE